MKGLSQDIIILPLQFPYQNLSATFEGEPPVSFKLLKAQLRRRREDGNRGQETEEAQEEKRQVLDEVNQPGITVFFLEDGIKG